MKVDKIREEVDRKARAVADLFETEQGAKVLKILESELDSDSIFSPCANTTNYNLGKRDAVVYIKQLIKHANKEQS